MLSSYQSIASMLLAEQRLLGNDHPSFVANKTQQVIHFKQTLSSQPADADQAKALYDELASGITDSLWTREEQQELAEAVSMHARSGASPEKADGTGARDQRHYWFHNYMPDWMWAEMLDRDVSVDKKLVTLAVHA